MCHKLMGQKKVGSPKISKRTKSRVGGYPQIPQTKQVFPVPKHYFQAFFSSSIFSPYWSIVSPFWEEKEEEYRGVGVKISVKEAASQFDGD